MKKSELRKIIKEEIQNLNEATYIQGKFNTQLKFFKKDIDSTIKLIKLNVFESPDYPSTKSESDKALKEIDKATNQFITNLTNAIKFVGTNYAGV